MRITTPKGKTICTLGDNTATFEDAYPIAVKIWDALTTSDPHMHCDGIQIREDKSHSDGVLFTINYTTHER
jgi:hypothetical protein